MEVRVKFVGVPGAVKAVGQKELTVQISQPTLGELLNQLRGTYGAPLGKALFTPQGAVDNAIQILHNGRDFLARDALDQPLDDGDQVTFMMMMAGG
ncbi:MAG TPA: MoaD/ThiS family protein [Deferrisomatales bacterium]|nr:MoaD/ThiS family protein [Deferrisomatales bacterium]